MLSVFLSRVFYCCHPLAESQGVNAISIAVQRTVGTAVRNTQDKKPEGHKKKILLILPPFFLILNLSQNVAELRQTGTTCNGPPQDGSCHSKARAGQGWEAQARRCGELQAGPTLTVRTFGAVQRCHPSAMRPWLTNVLSYCCGDG